MVYLLSMTNHNVPRFVTFWKIVIIYSAMFFPQHFETGALSLQSWENYYILIMPSLKNREHVLFYTCQLIQTSKCCPLNNFLSLSFIVTKFVTVATPAGEWIIPYDFQITWFNVKVKLLVPIPSAVHLIYIMMSLFDTF